jgi:hypothetical protein
MSSENRYRRIMKDSEVSGRKQQAKFGRPKLPMRNVKFSHGVGREVALDREQEERDQQTHGDRGSYETGKRQSAHQEQS